MRGYKINHLAITAVAGEARVNLALPVTAVVEFIAKCSNLCPRTVCRYRLQAQIVKSNTSVQVTTSIAATAISETTGIAD